MSHFTKLLCFMLISVVTVSCMAACGNDSKKVDDPKSGSDGEPTNAPAEQPTDEPAPQSTWTTGAKLPAEFRDLDYWKNVKFAILGDSITELNNYQHKVNAALKFKSMYVDGKSGTTISGSSGTRYYIRMNNIPTDSDVIFVFGGTNDYHYDVPLGQPGDTKATTFYGTIKKMCDRFAAKYPDSVVIFATPLQRKMPAGNNSADGLNSLGFSLEDYVNAIIEVCNQNNFVVMDLYHNSAINQETCEQYTFDLLHPNEEGFKVLADEIVAFLTDTGCAR